MRGLVLGKFLPYHLGHAHLIREARRHVDELVVLVCSIEREPIAGGLRFQWVRQAHRDCHVIHVAEEVPQSPDEHPQFWASSRRTCAQIAAGIPSGRTHVGRHLWPRGRARSRCGGGRRKGS